MKTLRKPSTGFFPVLYVAHYVYHSNLVPQMDSGLCQQNLKRASGTYGCRRAQPEVMTRAWCILLLAICMPAQAELQIHRIDDRVYRGKQPHDGDFAELAHMGIKTVLDLRGGMIHRPREKKLVEAAGMQYVSVRLSGLFPPKEQQMAEILALLEDPARGPVFVHCRHGDDRAGMVIACYRIAHDHWTNAKALEEARHLGLNPLELLMRRYILRFDANKLQVKSRQPGI